MRTERLVHHLSRRRFLAAALSSSAMGLATNRARAAVADEPHPIPTTNPKAISGDRVEPAWNELSTVSVGPHGGDFQGAGEKALQAAVDYVAQRGGGTVRVLPGTFRLRNAIYLPSRIRLVGSGPESILIKEPSVATKLAASSDWYDQEVTLADARGFQVGDGVCLRAKNPDTGGPVVIKRTLVARSGNRFKLDKALRENLWLEKGDPTAATLFPLISAENIADVVIENLVLDGNRANNDNLDGNYAGCIFAQDCSRLTFRGVIAHHNRIVDSGPANGVGIDVRGQTEHVSLAKNEVRETRGPMSRIGIRIGANTKNIVLTDNCVIGCACEVSDLGKASA